ncbi:hypothetical protein AAFO92_18175 [Roseovarius sp. CAU 1744]|uniref:hypothetical protein n=1 Tax=Roseovarius sp. CAU 1744 TaxID=3140368 RepID=UPI00325B69C3
MDSETKQSLANRLIIGVCLIAVPICCLVASSFFRSSGFAAENNLSGFLFFVAIFPGIAMFLFGVFMVMFAVAQALGLPKK